MGRRTWSGMSSAERAQMWERWHRGESMRSIARLLGRRHSTVDDAIRSTGGYRPAPRQRHVGVLTLAEREEISRGLCRGLSMRQLGRDLHRPASTICREIRRNGGPARYRAAQAERRAAARARRPKACLLARHARLRERVAQKLALQWSPQQISGWLVARFPHDQSMRVSHETIYRSLFIQTRGVLKKQLMEHLRSGRRMRHPRTQRRAGRGARPIAELLSIRERPAEAQDRAVPGHWEGDLLAGTTHSHIATLVERASRFVILVKLPARDSATVVKALSRQIVKLPAHLRRSLTWDRGSELAEHQQFKVATDVQVYFCDPYSPWQRGTNENTNGLLRQYFPRGESLTPYTQVQLNAIARRLNQRPRQTLGFRTPAEVLYPTVAPTD
jgi:IS30 family transposase